MDVVRDLSIITKIERLSSGYAFEKTMLDNANGSGDHLDTGYYAAIYDDSKRPMTELESWVWCIAQIRDRKKQIQ